jgi:hypothetical protein
MGAMRNSQGNISVEGPEGNRPTGRQRQRWDNNNEREFKETRCEVFGDVDWIHLAQDRDRWRALVNTVMNFRVS